MTQQFVPQIPTFNSGYGYRTPFGITLPPGGQVAAFVRSTGYQSQDDPNITNNLVLTLAAGLARCRPGLGDTVIVLPGHSESVVDNTMLNNLVAGTRIVGVGQGASQPTFRFTATAAQWIMNDADVSVIGLKLRLEGAAVVVALDISAADNTVTECDIETGSATSQAVVAIRVSAGGTRARIAGNKFRGIAAAVSTDIILINAAVDVVEILDNIMIAASTNGFFRSTAAATNIAIGRNRVYNTGGAAVAGVFGAQAIDGIVFDNYFAVKAAATGVTVITTGSSIVQYFQNGFTDGATLYAAMTVGSAVAS